MRLRYDVLRVGQLNVIPAEQAQSIVIGHLQGDAADERFVVQSCELSPRGDYWVVTANSEDYVVHGITERFHVGVSAYLVDAVSGSVEAVGSSVSWLDHLQDRYDLEAASGMSYVLVPAFGRDEKAALVNLRQRLGCPLQQAIVLLTADHRRWLTGRLRTLKQAQAFLHEQGIATTIQLEQETSNAVAVGEDVWHWEALSALILSRSAAGR